MISKQIGKLFKRGGKKVRKRGEKKGKKRKRKKIQGQKIKVGLVADFDKILIYVKIFLVGHRNFFIIGSFGS